MSFANGLTEELEKSLLVLRDKIKNYELEVEKKRQAELLELRRKQQELLDAENARILAEQTVDVPDVDEETGEMIMTPVIDKLIVPSRQDNSVSENQAKLQAELKALENQKTALRYTDKYRVTNINLVPLKYLMVNDAEIKLSMKAGVTQIAGIAFYQEPILNLR